MQNPTTKSQEWHKEDKLVREGVCERSAGTGTFVCGIENQLARTKLDHHNMHISNNQYFEKVFTNVRHKLNRLEDYQLLDQKVNVLTCGLLMSTTMKASGHLGPNDNEILIVV